jgi:hypothetical protein
MPKVVSLVVLQHDVETFSEQRAAEIVVSASPYGVEAPARMRSVSPMNKGEPPAKAPFGARTPIPIADESGSWRQPVGGARSRGDLHIAAAVVHPVLQGW